MRPTLRISLALLTALALSSTALVYAQAGAGGKSQTAPGSTTDKVAGTTGTVQPERFSFTLPKAPDSVVDPDRMHVVINRWSSTEERDRLFKMVQDAGAENLLREFRATGAIGYIRWPGGLEYSLRYAHRTPRPDGGSDIVLVTDRPIWLWWDDTEKVSTERFAYSAVQIRLTKAGTGEGRLAGPAGVTADKAAGVMLSNYDALASRLTDVRREQS